LSKSFFEMSGAKATAFDRILNLTRFRMALAAEYQNAETWPCCYTIRSRIQQSREWQEMVVVMRRERKVADMDAQVQDVCRRIENHWFERIRKIAAAANIHPDWQRRWLEAAWMVATRLLFDVDIRRNPTRGPSGHEGGPSGSVGYTDMNLLFVMR
jgi:hypothetical protein